MPQKTSRENSGSPPLRSIKGSEPLTDKAASDSPSKGAHQSRIPTLIIEDSENLFRQAFENAPGPVSINSPDGRFLKVNRTMCDLLGYSEIELLAMNFHEAACPEDQTIVKDHLAILLEAKNQTISFENRYRRKGGGIFPAVVNITLLRSKSGVPLFHIIHIRNLSQRRRLEEHLQQVQKMEAIGTLAGGIAHDFNNLLMAIQGRISLMSLDLDADHPHTAHLKAIEQHIQSAATLTRELLGFARGGKYAAKPTDLNELLKKTIHIFGRTKKEINIQNRLQPDLWTATADQGQIQQAVMNIFINAWQAMKEGGDLFIETQNVVLAEGDDCPEDIQFGNFIKIIVTDTGMGMDKKTQLRVFEPFFTTRQMGRGTGLGLASTYGIIRHHGGFITVESKKNRGSTFCVFLPASKGEEGDISRPTPPTRDHGTILLVDDEQIILEVGKQLIKKLGYHVIAAGNGNEAIEKYNVFGERINLVILDMVMPHPNGEETLRQLKKLDKNVKVIISSGYCLDPDTPPLCSMDYQKFIQKPFNLNELSNAIREVIEIECP